MEPRYLKLEGEKKQQQQQSNVKKPLHFLFFFFNLFFSTLIFFFSYTLFLSLGKVSPMLNDNNNNVGNSRNYTFAWSLVDESLKGNNKGRVMGSFPLSSCSSSPWLCAQRNSKHIGTNTTAVTKRGGTRGLWRKHFGACEGGWQWGKTISITILLKLFNPTP